MRFQYKQTPTQKETEPFYTNSHYHQSRHLPLLVAIACLLIPLPRSTVIFLRAEKPLDSSLCPQCLLRAWLTLDIQYVCIGMSD